MATGFPRRMASHLRRRHSASGVRRCGGGGVGPPRVLSRGLERPAAEFEVLEACLEESQKLLVGQPVAQARLTLPKRRQDLLKKALGAPGVGIGTIDQTSRTLATLVRSSGARDAGTR